MQRYKARLLCLLERAVFNLLVLGLCALPCIIPCMFRLLPCRRLGRNVCFGLDSFFDWDIALIMSKMSQRERGKVVEICSQIINGEGDFLELCRKMSSLRSDLDLDLNLECNKDFIPFVGVASETLDYPSKEKREHFSKDFLERVDKEVAEYISTIRPVVFDACRSLIDKYHE